MKYRSIITTIGIALALIVMFATLPIQAQTNNGAAISNFNFSGRGDNGHLQFSWDTIEGESIKYFHIKGGGWLDTWASVYLRQVVRVDGKTYAAINPLYWVAGTKFRFRLRLNTPNGSTPWAKLTVDLN